MSAPGTQHARSARDALTQLLGLGVPYPLRDLTLDFAADVAHGLPTDILIRSAQAGVVYQLCSDEGDPLPGADKQPISVQLSADHGGEPTLASTPVFIPGDLRDAAAFLRPLLPGAVGVGALLRRRLKPETLALLDASDAASGGSDSVRAAVLSDLSGVVRQGSLYDAQAFGDVCLSPWTRQLLGKATRTDTELTRLNRFLVEDAFPLALWRTLTLSTPPITEDVAFTVLASREESDALVEGTLTAGASIRAGISATLSVLFLPDETTATAVPYGGLATVAVDGTQEGISYQLFSTQSPPVALSDAQPGNRVTVTLTTNVPLTRNTGLQVKAFRTSAPTVLKYLNATLQLTVGPNSVRFSPGADTTVAVPFGGIPAAVAVDQSQASVSYQLFSTQSTPAALSDPQPGNGSTVMLPINAALPEDTGIQVKAFLTTTPATFLYLTNALQVNVGPDPAVTVQATPPIADYNGSPLFSLAGAQRTAQYTLWQRPIAPADYTAPETPGLHVPVLVPADPAADPPWFRFVGAPAAADGQPAFRVAVSVPDPGDGTQVPPGFAVMGDFKGVDAALQITTTPLQEDTLFIVWAKKQNGAGLILNQKVAVLVRPDPQRPLSADQSSVAKDTPGLVLVGNAQEGVRYRLLNDADGTPVMNPGYPAAARELGTARVEADFAIEAPADSTVALPTGPLAGPAKFRVMAIKNATALTAPLNGTVSLDVTPPPAHPAAPPAGNPA